MGLYLSKYSLDNTYTLDNIRGLQCIYVGPLFNLQLKVDPIISHVHNITFEEKNYMILNYSSNYVLSKRYYYL